MIKRIPGLTYIDGQPYQVHLPKGGNRLSGLDWDRMIMFLNGSDERFHWKGIFSWCMEPDVCRGETLYGCGWAHRPDTQAENIGFRPVLTPLDTETMEPDPNAWPGIEDGEVITFGSLYMGGKAVSVRNESTNEPLLTAYVPGTSLTIGDSVPDPQKQIPFIKFKGELWATQNLLNFISWRDLQRQGFCNEMQKRERASSLINIAKQAEQHAYAAYQRFSDPPKYIIIFAADEGEAMERALNHFGYPASDWSRLSTGTGPISVNRFSPTKDFQVFEI